MEELFTILAENPHYVTAFILYIAGTALSTVFNIVFNKQKPAEALQIAREKTLEKLRKKEAKQLEAMKKTIKKEELLEKEIEKNA